MRNWEDGAGRAYLALAGVTVSWGTIPLIVRHLDVTGTALVAARLAIGAVGAGAAIALHRGGRYRGPRLFSYRPGWCVVVAAVLAVHWVTLFEAYKRTEVSTVILIVYMAPVGVAVVAPRVLGEHVSRRTWASLLVAVLGFMLLAGPSVGAASVVGLVLAALSALLFVGLIIVSKPLAEAYGGLRTAFIEFTGASVLLAPFLVTAPWSRLRGGDWVLLATLGLVLTGAAASLYLFALARVPATNAGIMGYLEPVSAVTLSWLVLHEPLRWTSIVGGALIVAAGIVVVRGSGPSLEEASAHVAR